MMVQYSLCLWSDFMCLVRPINVVYLLWISVFAISSSQRHEWNKPNENKRKRIIAQQNSPTPKPPLRSLISTVRKRSISLRPEKVLFSAFKTGKDLFCVGIPLNQNAIPPAWWKKVRQCIVLSFKLHDPLTDVLFIASNAWTPNRTYANALPQINRFPSLMVGSSSTASFYRGFPGTLCFERAPTKTNCTRRNGLSFRSKAR